MKVYPRILITALLLLLALTPVALSMPVGADSRTHVTIDCASAAQGETTTTNINVFMDDPDGLGSATMTLTVDPAVVNVVTVSGSDLGSLSWNTAGAITTIVAATGFLQGPTGIVNFATITLEAVGSTGETSALDLEVTSMYDGTVLPLEPRITDCSFQVTSRPLGDVNDDGIIDCADLQLIAQHIAGVYILTGADFKAADVNRSSSIDSADFQLMVQYILMQIPGFLTLA